MERVNENDLQYRAGDHGPKYLFRGNLYEWGVCRLLPNGTLGAHFHGEVEETFYFPNGGGIIVVDGKEHQIRPGDAFKISPTEPHDIVNDTDDPIELIFIKCPYLPEDKKPL
jgi:mannose-6-phosphate isomerase-like protein (cupin superfamily)